MTKRPASTGRFFLRIVGNTAILCQHFGRNATDKLSKTLVIRIKAKDKPVTTEVK
jgi:hypothetical protein